MISSSAETSQASPAAPQLSPALYNRLFWAALAVFEAFLLSLPLVPSGDGPMHIYLSTVLWKLAAHASPTYAHYYAIRHLVQPYSFHYYLLIGLQHFLSADASEKVFAGIIWATLALGFRALCRELAPQSPAGPLLALAFLFSWPFAAGFFNFTFGCGLLLWALVFYLRLRPGTRATRNAAALLLLLIVLVLAHPVPLMILIFLVGCDLALQLWEQRRHGAALRLPKLQAAAFATSCIAFIFPVLIADKAAVAGSAGQFFPHPQLLKYLLTGTRVAYFQIVSPGGLLLQFALTAILPAAVVFLLKSGLRGRLRAGTLSALDRLFVGVVLFLGASLCMPDIMNGSYYFNVRMWYPLWVLSAVCLAAAAQGIRSQRAIAAFSMAVAVLSLWYGVRSVRPIAEQQAALERAPLPPHARGLLLQPPSTLVAKNTHTWYSLNWWDGVRAFNAHGDVLLNTPWLALTIVPVQENGKAGLLRDSTPPLYSENGSFTLSDLQASPSEKAAALKLADFLLFSDGNDNPPQPLGLAMSFLGQARSDWDCTDRQFYAVCVRSSSAPALRPGE